MLTNHCDFNVTRKELRKSCNRIVQALERKYEEKQLDNKDLRLWMENIVEVESALHNQLTSEANERYISFRSLSIEEGLFTERDFAVKFGNGHPRGCGCVDCVNADPHLSRRAKAKASRVELVRAFQIKQHRLKLARA